MVTVDMVIITMGTVSWSRPMMYSEGNSLLTEHGLEDALEAFSYLLTGSTAQSRVVVCVCECVRVCVCVCM